MSELDTSAAAVERLRYGCENYNGDWLINNSGLIAATLRALVAERDMWRAENIKKQESCEQMGRRITALEAERSVLIDVLTSINRETGRARGEQAHRDATRFACVVSAKAIARKNP